MAYRIQLFRTDLKLADLASNRPLPDAREEAVNFIDMFDADYALIVDGAGQLIDRMKRSA
jgi:hypothetical protein